MKKANITIMVFTAMNFVLSMTGLVFNGILDKVAVSLGITVANAGLLNTMYAYGGAIGVPITLIVFRKVERIRLLKVMLLIAIVTTVVLVSVQSFGVLLAVRLLMGIAVNSYGVLAISLVLSLTERDKQGRTMALLIVGNSLALVIGIPLTRALSSVLDWRSIFWILNAMMAAALIYFQLFLPEGDSNAAKIDLKNELSLLKEGKTLLIIVFSVLMFLGYGGFYTYVTPYLLILFPSFEAVMSILLVFLGLASFIGNWIGGIVSDKIGFAKSMLVGATLQIAAIVLIVVFQPVKWMTLICVILYMMSAWFTGLQLNTGVSQVTENKSSLLISLNSSGIQLGGALGSSIIAVIMSVTSIKNIVILPLITSIGIFVLQSFYNKRYLKTIEQNKY